MGRIGTARSGRDTSGNQKNNKVVVWGYINVTSYTTGGETVAPKDLGLNTIDFITFDCRTANNAATEPATGAMLDVGYIRSTNKVLIDVNETQVTSTQAATLTYLAAGDAAVADLT